MKRIAKLFLAFTLYLALSFPALAEVKSAPVKNPEPGKIFGDWIINCEPQADKSSKCFATQYQYVTQAGQRIVTPQPITELGKIYNLNVGYLGPKGELQIVAFLPLGIDIVSGAQMKLEPGPSVALPIVTCIPEGCRVTANLDDAAQKAMLEVKAAEINIVSYVVNAEKPAAQALVVSVRGLAAALSSLK